MSWQAILLSPLSLLYGQVSGARISRSPRHRSRFPVVCVGNFTAGGTGKTPLAIAIAAIVREAGLNPVYLTRGYGGSLAGPIVIDLHAHRASEVSDEPLLLAREAPTVVARDRIAGVKLIEHTFGDGTVIIMDDGLQNPAVAKDLTLAVVDARRRFGNGFCLPAGPLRAPLLTQAPLVDAVIVNGSDPSAPLSHFPELSARRPGLEVFQGSVAPAADCAWVKGARLLAFSGIANPARFYSLLRNLGAAEVHEHTFPDHHQFTAGEAEILLQKAHRTGLRLVTTEKDFVRLQGAADERGELRNQSMTIPIVMTLEPKARPFIETLLKSPRGNRGR